MMWSRVIEMLLGLWLAAGPVFVPQLIQPPPWRLLDIGLGSVTIVLAAASFWPRAHFAHLLLLVVGAVLIASGYLFLGAPPPAAQNRAVVGFLLLMFAIIPNHASRPPRSWNDAPLRALRTPAD
jgi:hypothetical protein